MYLLTQVVESTLALLAPHGELRGEQYAIRALLVSNHFVSLAWSALFLGGSSLTTFRGDGNDIRYGCL
jgi:hypothetical protein